MAKKLGNPLKVALRKHMKTEVLPKMTPESRKQQSEAITKKVIHSDDFCNARSISIYLSTAGEVDTTEILRESFRLRKKVFVPTYSGNNMEMVRLIDMHDYDALPLTKWKIKQPDADTSRENALINCEGIDLFIMPGVAFTLNGGRMGHGMGYYDKFLQRHFTIYPQKKVTLMAVAFREQIVDDDILPLDPHDVRLTYVITE